METTARSPRIHVVEWGAVEVEGLGRLRDAKLWPGGGREWDWRETGTHHVPGIQPADVAELLEHGTEVIVLSRGMALRLETGPETLDHLRDQSVVCHVDETRAAVRQYNRFVDEGRRVGGLFHSTC